MACIIYVFTTDCTKIQNGPKFLHDQVRLIYLIIIIIIIIIKNCL